MSELNDINILFVDDDENLYLIYNDLLQEEISDKIVFDHAPTAENLLEKLSEKQYDIVVLDQKLNNGNRGLDFLPKIKSNNIYTYVIVNSGYGNETLAVESIRNGADDYVKGNKEDNDEFLISIKKAIAAVKKLKIIDNFSSKLISFNRTIEEKFSARIIESKNKISAMAVR